MAGMTIFEALRQSHFTQRHLIDRMLDAQAPSPMRLSLFQQLKTELSAHAAAEERCFYVPLIAHDETQESARHGMAEHHAMDKLVHALEAMASVSPHWILKGRELRHAIEHHLNEEEQRIFPRAAQVLGEDDAQSLAQAYEEAFNALREKA